MFPFGDTFKLDITGSEQRPQQHRHAIGAALPILGHDIVVVESAGTTSCHRQRHYGY